MDNHDGVKPNAISSEDAKKAPVAELLKKLASSEKGISDSEAKDRLKAYGYNEISEKKVSPLVKFLRYFWGPIPWMIEIAALLSAVVRHWPDLIIVLLLLVFNGVVGFWQEFQAGNAVEQLKKGLALKARVLRDQKWQELDSRELVPGDVVRLRLGDVIPADIKLMDGDYLSVDQSALTGESLPVSKKTGDIAYSGSVAKQGEMAGLVTATGMDTFFGHTAKLVSAARSVSHFQKAVLTIGDFLIYICIALVSVLILVGLYRHLPLIELAQFALILTIASIPVAMPAVLSVTMAVGALALSKLKAIVSRLESIEEIAGISVLCSDKTGTLTRNRLTLGEPVTFAAADSQELILAATLASRLENQDAIDLAVFQGLKEKSVLNSYQQQKFIPFDPVAKRTEATVTETDGKTFRVTKGAPQVIFEMCDMDINANAEAEQTVNDFAAKGYRTLGVARTNGNGQWTFLGILPMYDPPRDDAAETIAMAKTHGIEVKMVTGDNTAIARETAGVLGLGQNILPADDLIGKGAGNLLDAETAKRVEKADGYAQVFPEHKYQIVKALQSRDLLVGMTGDGVNDSPALKQADVGIAVSGATDAARAAADLVLTKPGLNVIIQAIEEARRIFERMNAYAIYRITETIRIMIFMVLAMLVYNFYPMTAIMIILLALLNDLPIMTIAKDNTWLDPNPVRWDMHRVLTIAGVLGGIGVIETFALLIIAKSWFGLGLAELQTVIFLKLAVAGHMTLFVARTRHSFTTRPYPAPILLAAIAGTQVLAALIAAFGWFVTPIPWSYIGLIWAYCIVWIFIEDAIKLAVYRHIERTGPRHRRFLDLLKGSMHAHQK
ncbi:MAG: plasma-membrane proton-efflux P-type ATPase [Deltaproteobacteria bacterium]|nr:plasma-membrane proton-efflux P-type ATPase [Deltaproteobacteria bacterium]